MLVNGIRQGGQIHAVAGVHHVIGEGCAFFVGHGVEAHRHQKRRGLVFGDGTVGDAAHKKRDFLISENSAAFLFHDQIVHSHGYAFLLGLVWWLMMA